MKVFVENDVVTYNLMSFTGFKSLLLFSALYQKPRTYDEIKEIFDNQKYLKETISKDTLRVYINSLEMMGCQIIKEKKSQGGRYVLLKHPFEFSVNDEYVKSLLEVYKNLIDDIEIEDLLTLTKFFDKISTCVANEELKAKLMNISPITKVDKEILKSLVIACRKNDEITIKYKSPKSGIKSIDVLAQKLKLNKGRIYLCGTSINYNNDTTFMVSRIVDIPVVKLKKTQKQIEPIKVLCEFYDKNIILNENETVIEETDTKRIVEISSKNLFYTKQRVLALNSSCKVLAPLDFKKDIVATLRKMRNNYDK